MKTRIYNLVILDESGSMEAIKSAAISSINETFQTIRNAMQNHPEQEHYVSFVTFNSSKIKTIYDCINADAITEINNNQYQPNAGTPLYDAIGTAIATLRPKVAPQEKVLVTIVTDGLENCSSEYTNHTINKIITELKSHNWVFVYMGANHDVESFAENINIHNHMQFEADTEGMHECIRACNKGRANFYDRIEANEMDLSMDEDTKFFSI